MANNFPPPPADLQLASLEYLAILPPVSVQAGSLLDYGAAVNSQLVYTVPNLGATFAFTTPGSFGLFDQDVFEAALKQSVTAVCQVLAAMSGIPLTTVEGGVQVRRTWTWVTAEGHQLVWQDTMTYP